MPPAVYLPTGVTVEQCFFRKTSDLYTMSYFVILELFYFIRQIFSSSFLRRHYLLCLLGGNAPDVYTL